MNIALTKQLRSYNRTWNNYIVLSNTGSSIELCYNAETGIYYVISVVNCMFS